MVRINSKRKNHDMIKNFLRIFFLFIIISTSIVNSSEDEIYQKIDVFGEVLEKIYKEYLY